MYGRKYAERQTCAYCGYPGAVRNPKGGDGTVMVMYHHSRYDGGLRGVRCEGSGMPSKETATEEDAQRAAQVVADVKERNEEKRRRGTHLSIYNHLERAKVAATSASETQLRREIASLMERVSDRLKEKGYDPKDRY